MGYERYESPIGTLWLRGDASGLKAIDFAPRGPEETAGGELDLVKSWLDGYFRGSPREIGFLLSPEGTVFQQLIWKLLLQIPFGETASYGDLAKEAAARLGKENMSAQAVGHAVGKNPIAIVIPCHRVVGTKGQLTGYAWGIEKKQWLLNHEQRYFGG